MLKNTCTMKCQKTLTKLTNIQFQRHKEHGSYLKARPKVLEYLVPHGFGSRVLVKRPDGTPKIILSHKKWTGMTNTLANSYMYALFYVWRMIIADKQRLYSETTFLLRATGCSHFNDGGKTGKSIKWNCIDIFFSLIYVFRKDTQCS